MVVKEFPSTFQVDTPFLDLALEEHNRAREAAGKARVAKAGELPWTVVRQLVVRADQLKQSTRDVSR